MPNLFFRYLFGSNAPSPDPQAASADTQAASSSQLNIFEALPQGLGPLDHLLSYLNPEDIAHLSSTCTALRSILSELEVLWQPHLNCLRDIDKQVVMELDPRDSISKRFGKAFEQINNRQVEEIANFVVGVQYNQIALPHGMKVYLLGMKVATPLYRMFSLPQIKPATKLETLQDRHQFLNNLNARIILDNIDPTQTVLDISNKYLTRFPKELFEEANLQNYWQALLAINCSYNQLRTLPDYLGTCIRLTRLRCSGNLLESLPESLGQCRLLVGLDCSHNQLKALPDLGRCGSLIRLKCDNNQIEVFPDSLGNSGALVWLYCYHNRLKTLPVSLGNCTLSELSCNYNRIQTLPDAIWSSYGYLNCMVILANQNIMLIERIAQQFPSLPAYLSSEANDAHTSAIRDQPEDAQQDDDNPRPLRRQRR